MFAKGETLQQNPGLSDGHSPLQKGDDALKRQEEQGGFNSTIRFLTDSEAEEQRQQQAEAQQRKAEISRVRRQLMFAFFGFLAVAALAAWGISERNRAEAQAERATASEKVRSKELFNSTLTHAALLARGEDYAAARKKLKLTQNLNDDVPAPRRHARDLLKGYVEIMGAAPQTTFQDGDKPLPQLSGGVAISPDGRWLATSGERGTVALFERESGRLVQKLVGHDPSAGSNGSVRDVVFYPDPEQPWLFSAGADGQIIRWVLLQPDKAAEQVQHWQVDAGEANALAITPDGKVLASGHDDGKIRLWAVQSADKGGNAPKLLRVLEGHSHLISAVAFSPDGQQLASTSYGHSVRLWDWQQGEGRALRKVHTDDVHGVAYSADGQWLASSSADQSIILWDAQSGQPRQRLKGHQNMVAGLQFLGQGLLASASSDNTIRLWDVATGVTRRVLQGHTATVKGLSLWLPASQDEQPQVQPSLPLLYSNSNDGTVKRWSAELAGQWLLDLPDWQEGSSATIAPNGQWLAVGQAGGRLLVYDLASRTLLFENKEVHSNNIKRLVFNAEGTRLASSDMGGLITLWSISATGELSLEQTFNKHNDMVHGLAFATDGSRLASGSFDGRIGLFDLAGDEEPVLFAAHEGYVASVAFDYTGKHLISAGYQDQQVKQWDLSQQPPAPHPLANANNWLLWASLSPDSESIASVGRGGNVTVSSTNHLDTPLVLHGHEQTVFKAIFSPDGRQLATMSGDMTVRLWDLDTESELFSLRLPEEPTNSGPWDFDFRCTPTGCWVAVPLTSGKLALYNLGQIDYAENTEPYHNAK